MPKTPAIMEGDIVEFANAATKDERVKGKVDWAFRNDYLDVVTGDNMFRVHTGDVLSVNGSEVE